MKGITNNITQMLSRVLRYSKTVSHLKHYRGYGVHSPFAYSLERNVFLQRGFLSEDKRLYDILRKNDVGDRRATQIQNMYHYCAYSDYVVDGLDKCGIKENVLYVATKHSDERQISKFVARTADVKLTLCVVYPRNSKQRSKLCKVLIKSHTGMSVDNIGFILYFYNDRKKKQHIIL